MKPRLLYVFAARHPQPLRELVRSHIPDSEYEVRSMHYETPPDRMSELMEWADFVLFAPGRYLPDEVVEAGRRVRLMQLWSSGYDKFNIAAATRAGIPVANNGGANRIAVAEHTILLMLAVFKRLPESHSRTVEGRWEGNSHGMDMFLLYRKRLGLIGMGAIGREVAMRAAGFGMEVLYFDPRRLPASEEEVLGVKFAPMDEIIETSHIISPHVHLNDQTRAMIGEAEIARMRTGAVLINVSRGELFDYDAVLRGLSEGKLGGAGFDVYATEPTVANDPLLMHPNVVCTPHMACTFDTHVMALEASMSNIGRVRNGLEPLWVVN